MGITERREREKQQRQNDIIDAAEHIFFSKGLTEAKMDDVAEEAELSKGTLYLYFKSKEDLYFAICLRGLKIMENLFREAANKARTGLEKTKAIGKAYHQFFKEYPDYFHVMIHFESHPKDFGKAAKEGTEYTDPGEKTLGILAAALKQGIQDGTVRPEIDPKQTAVVLWGQTYGIIQLIALKGKHLEEGHGMNSDKLLEYAFQLQGLMLSKES